MLLVILITLVAAGQGNIIESRSASVIFRERGSLELSGKSYYVVLDVSIDGLLESIQPIGIAVKEISDGLESELLYIESQAPRRTNKELNESMESKNLSMTLTTSMRGHMRFLVADLSQRHKSLINFLRSLSSYDLNPIEPTREARGLMDIGGSVLSWVFGLATNEEITDTNEILARVNELSETNRGMVNIHSEILNNSAIQFEEIDNHLSRVDICLEQVQNNIISLRNHLVNVYNHQFTIEHSLIMTNSLSYASSAITDLNTQFITLKQGLDKLRAGYITSELMPPDTILKLINLISKKDLNPILPASEEYLAALYKYIRVTSLPHNALAFVISIPLEGDPKVKLKVYECFSLPHPVNERLTLTYSNLPRYLAVSDDRRIFMEYRNLESCRHHQNKFLCPIDMPVYRDGTPSCALNLFKGLADTNVCEKHFSKALDRPLITKTTAGWLYSISTEDKVTITCPEGTSHVILHAGSGRINAHDNCKLTGKHFILPSSGDIRGDTIVRNVSLVVPFILNLTNTELESIDLLNSSSIFDDIMSLTNNKLSLKSLRGEIKNLKYIKQMRQINSITGNTGLSLSIISFIAIIVIIVIIMAFCRVSKEDEQETSEEVGRPRPKSHIKFQFRNKFFERNDSSRQAQSMPLTETTQLTDEPEEQTPQGTSPQSPSVYRPHAQPRSTVHDATRHTSHLSETFTMNDQAEIITAEKPSFSPNTERKMWQYPPS